MFRRSRDSRADPTSSRAARALPRLTASIATKIGTRRTRRALAAAAAGALPALLRVARRSGASHADVQRDLAGDGLIADPEIQIDRATVIRAPARAVWPWLVQLGKGRGGWYMPGWLERLIVWPPRKRSAKRIVDELQSLAAGDLVPDWGRGDPSFKVIELDPPRALVYLSLRDRARNWTWPADDPPHSEVLAFSWALVLEEIDAERCRLHIRLRGRFGKRGRLRPVFVSLGGLVDYLTIIAMFAGLKQRVAQARQAPAAE
jgi:hypothetical protein